MRSAVFVVAAVALATLTACGRPHRAPVRAPTEAEQRAQSRTVSVITLGTHALEGGLQASGTLLPREDTAIFPQINGYRVLRVLADEGQWVQSGQTLAVLDDTLLRSQMAQQEAILGQLTVQAERARSEAVRVNGLDGDGVLSQEAVEARRFAARAAAAQAAAQAAAVRDIRTRLGQLSVRAPYSGLVIERNVRTGDIAGGATPWFRMARGGEVELAADVAESALSGLRPGGSAQVTLADGTQVPGVIRLVSPRVDATTKLGRVRISLPVSPDVRAGGFARASFTGMNAPVLAVPEGAIRYDAAGAALMVVDANNRVRRQAVTTGRRGGGYVELLSGPPAGARVVSRFGSMLVPGDVVRTVNDDTQGQSPPAAAGAPPAAPAAAPVRPAAPAGALRR